MPIVDRDKFIQSKHGTRGSGAEAEDSIGGNACKELRGLYVCASTREMFDHVGKGLLAGKLDAGARGDIEVYMTDTPLLGDTTGDLVVAAKLEPGIVDVTGRWTGTPSGILGKLVGIAAPHAQTANASGFVALNIAPLRSVNPMAFAYLEAARLAGFELNPDFNGPRQNGVGLYTFTQKSGERVTAEGAYLDPVRNRPNLTVIADTQVTKVLFDGRTATGIAWQRGGETHTLSARNPVRSGLTRRFAFNRVSQCQPHFWSALRFSRRPSDSADLSFCHISV